MAPDQSGRSGLIFSRFNVKATVAGTTEAGTTGGQAAAGKLAAKLGISIDDPKRVLTRALDRYAMANDASHFLLVPQAVVVAKDSAEVARLLSALAAQGVPLTFRSGGTSLSGQGLSDSVLVDVRRNFRRIDVLDDGARVRVQPGATVLQVNTRLARHGHDARHALRDRNARNQ